MQPSDIPEDIDLADYPTAEEAAKATHEYLEEYAEATGHDPSWVRIRGPDEYRTDCWAVIWEGGPYHWALSLTRGESITGGELPELGRGDAQITGWYEQDHWGVECGNSFTLEFWQR